MAVIAVLLHSVSIVVGIALVALSLDTPPVRRVSLVTGIVLIVLGLIIK